MVWRRHFSDFQKTLGFFPSNVQGMYSPMELKVKDSIPCANKEFLRKISLA
jgi:hypothetical protein